MNEAAPAAADWMVPSWAVERTQRLISEEAMLQRYWPSFSLQYPLDAERAAMVGRVRGPAGLEFVLWITLAGYPASAPALYIIEPRPLCDADGLLLYGDGTAPSGFICFEPSSTHPQICYAEDRPWSEETKLELIVAVAHRWITAYEVHLQTRQPLSRVIASRWKTLSL